MLPSHLRNSVKARSLRANTNPRACSSRHGALMALLLLPVLACTSQLAAEPVPNAARAAQARPKPAAAASTVRLSDFTAASTCADCHPTQAADWGVSAHAHAMRDIVFQALVTRARTESPDAAAFCLSCHSNVGAAAQSLPADGAFEGLDPVIQEGITCESCHRVTEVVQPFNAAHVLDPRAPMQGTVRARDGSPYHDTQRSDIISSPELCASCHDVMTPEGVVLEQPYREWDAAPAKRDGLVCIDCHMPKTYGQSAKDFGLPPRPLRRHTFLGPSLLTRASESGALADATLAAEVTAQLQHSLRLTLQPPALSPDARSGKLDAIVESLVSGHRMPTGSAFFRQLYLGLSISDAAGKVIYDSSDGASTAPPEPLRTRLFDAHGQHTLFPWRAASVENLTLAPLERRAIQLTFTLPPAAQGPLTFHVGLYFRTFPAQLLEDLGLDASLATTVEIAARSTRLELSPAGAATAASSAVDEADVSAASARAPRVDTAGSVD